MILHMRSWWLRRRGWRQGRDKLWRNDAYGGSWKTRNAIKQELHRPVQRQLKINRG